MAEMRKRLCVRDGWAVEKSWTKWVLRNEEVIAVTYRDHRNRWLAYAETDNRMEVRGARTRRGAFLALFKLLEIDGKLYD